MEVIPEVLVRNLRALAEHDRGLAERLLLPADNVDLRFEGRRALYRHHLEWIDLEPPAPAPDAAAVLWFGVGVGDGLDQALRARPGLSVVAWERDPWMLRQALLRHDWGEALRSRRLTLRLGVDVLSLAGSDLPVVEHPVLGPVYALERHLVDHGAAGPRVCLCTGKLFTQDMAAALRRRGLVVVPIDDQGWSQEELSSAMRRVVPTCLVRVNYTGGVAEFAHEHGVPLIVWEIDPATDGIRPPTAPTGGAHVFTFRRASVELYRTAGFENVEHLPLASPVERRRPVELSDEERAHYTAPVAFVGGSLVDSADELGGRLDELYSAFAGELALPAFRASCRELLDLQARAGSWILPQLFEERFEEFLGALPEGGEMPAALLGERAASERRLAVVQLLADQGIHVWGDRGYEVLDGVRYRGPARHGEELTRIYGAVPIHVDVGRSYQSDIVTMRVFDVLACGGFLIAERSAELADQFEIGRELEAWSTLSELKHKVRYYRSHPAEARAIAEAGRAAVLARHTFDLRVERMLRAALQPA